MPRKHPVAKELQGVISEALAKGCKLEHGRRHAYLLTPKGARVIFHRGTKVHKEQRHFLRRNLRKAGVDV
jgi:hypothetical protein